MRSLSLAIIAADPERAKVPVSVPYFLILEGAARIAYGDETFDAAAGETISLRRGVPHAWGNPSAAPLRMVVIASPGGCEEALRIIAKGGDIDFAGLLKKFNIRNIGPPLLGDKH